MDRVNRLLHHANFISYLQAIEECEIDRIYCKHNMVHLMDVARLTYIKVLMEKLPLEQSVIYATALLHDIGKPQQYRQNIPHEQASAKLAPAILKDCDYTPDEIKLITQMIRYHRGFTLDYEAEQISSEAKRMIQLFQEADKQSRMCFACKAQATCKWPQEKKNLCITL